MTSKSGNICDNMELLPNPPRFLAEYAYTIGVTDKTLENCSKQIPEFLLAYTRAKQIQREHITKLGNMGLYNSNFAQFTMVNISDWRIKNNVELSGKVDSQIFFENMLTSSSAALANERKVFAN